MKTFRAFGAAILAAAICLGCTNLSSSDIKTSGINAAFLVSADGTGSTQAGASLTVKGNLLDFVNLASGDVLTAKAGGESQTLGKTDVLGVINYNASFSDQGSPGTEYTLSLTRGAGDTSAPSSTCTLPQPFTLTAPASGKTFSRADDDITVSYSGSGQSDPLGWSASGNCIIQSNGSVPSDSGSFTIPKGTLQSSTHFPDGGSSPATCEVTLTLSRSRAGTLDPAFGGGSIGCAQNRSVTFTSNP